MIRVKVTAIFLAPAGLGFVAQVTDLRVFISRFVDLGVGAGLTKYVAAYNTADDKRAIEGLLQTCISGFAITGGLIVLICIIFAPGIADLVLGDSTLWYLVTLAGITAALTAQGRIVYRTLQGLLKIRSMVILGLISSFLGLIITIPLIIFFGVTGAVLSVALLALFSLVFGHLYLQLSILRKREIHLRLVIPKKKILYQLLRFGGVSSLQVLSDALTLLIIRSIIIKQFGAGANGLYQVAIAVSVRYLGIIFTSIWQYSLPKLSTLLNNRRAQSKVQNDTLKLIFLAVTPLIVLILVFRTIWIPLLYTTTFLFAYPLITWQMLGDVFKSITNPENMILLPKELFTFFIIITLTYSAIQLISFWLLLPIYGLVAAPIAYAIGRAFTVPITLFYHYRYEHFIYSKSNWWLIAKSVFTIILVMVLTASPGVNYLVGYIIPLTALILWASTAISRKEAVEVIQIGSRYVQRIRTRETSTDSDTNSRPEG